MKEAVPFSHVFPVNSYVLYRPPDNSRHKMQMPKAGPYIVVSVLGDKYSIQDLLTHKLLYHNLNGCQIMSNKSSLQKPVSPQHFSCISQTV
jgi:hypothetical protein